MAGVNWSYFEKFKELNDTYLPDMGEGTNMATQAVTAVNKLVYKWYNDGDVYDNTYYLSGWANDLSSYANWLANYIPGAKKILDGIFRLISEREYEELLAKLADNVLDEKFLQQLSTSTTVDSIYSAEGTYVFQEYEEDEEDDWDEEGWDEYEDEDY